MLPQKTDLPDLHSIERLAVPPSSLRCDPLTRDVDARQLPHSDWLDRSGSRDSQG